MAGSTPALWRLAFERVGLLQMLGKRRLIIGGGEREFCCDVVGDIGYRDRAEMTRGDEL